MTEYIWLLESVIHAVHDEQIAEHGGLEGTRDINLLRSALARPENLVAYSRSDVFELAASYGYGIAKNHPFNDGNKRTAFLATELFLYLNNYSLNADDGECVLIMLQLAEGKISEEGFSQWIKNNTTILS